MISNLTTLIPKALCSVRSKHFLLLVLAIGTGSACSDKRPTTLPDNSFLVGTWRLIDATLIENKDTVVTDYTGSVSFIKIINATHFSFIQHDRTKGKDSTAVFSAGAGSYLLKESLYTEHLEYCSAREWEGNDFTFTASIKNDTLVQQGVEHIESLNVNRINSERYVRIQH